MLQPATAPPEHISPEEHTALTSSTPADFTSIPPVLRWSNENVQVEVGGEGWYDGQDRVGGTIWVTERAVTFLPANQAQQGFTLSYQSLTLHALTPASADGSTPAHVYCQIDETQHAEGAEDDGEDWEMREVRIYVDPVQLSPLFEALSDCSALHASLLPNGQTSSFPFFDGEDGAEDDDEEAWEDAEEDGPNGEAGRSESAKRLRTDHNGHHVNGDANGETDGNVSLDDRLANMVEWGDIPKPKNW